MKSIIILSALILCFFTVCEKNTKREIKTNKNIPQKYREWKSFYKNGQLKENGNFLDKKKNGEWKYFFESGQLNVVTHYNKNGDPDGERRAYFKNGNLRETGYYVNGKIDGEVRFYYRNGKLKEIGHFTAGEVSGKWTEYDKNGNIINAK